MRLQNLGLKILYGKKCSRTFFQMDNLQGSRLTVIPFKKIYIKNLEKQKEKENKITSFVINNEIRDIGGSR